MLIENGDQKKIVYYLYNLCLLDNNNFDCPLIAFVQPLKLSKVLLKNKQIAQINMGHIEKSVFCGTCVGDSRFQINKHYANARLQCGHSTKQSAWFFWKFVVCLKDYCYGLESVVFQSEFQTADGKQKPTLNPYKGKLKIATKANPTLTELYHIIYKKKKLKIKRNWLNHMNNYFLMTLWLDDGSLYNQRQGVFCLDTIDLAEQKILSIYFKKVWNFQCVIREKSGKSNAGHKQYRLHIKDQQNLLIFLRIIAPIIPIKHMLYKVLFVPKNNIDLLQRWVSEISQLVHPNFQTYVIDYYKPIVMEAYNRSEKDIVHS